ncbi:toll/interleukin-1 receptor domain-containing protein [Crocosphaera sp.]|uniref:toll/interleukin-1 receptor domain-containing protein n=1 Tax=Crocosphaera sp. TaxID=2729996 RepID=UPI0026152564|nr:toll/interleukin-1 receptor domain-containing protein [Crocosphaera sp.]MDJ0579638.1 toll/interleukin-1 receptor domain-containing protein [Crocosphaera sp.]
MEKQKNSDLTTREAVFISYAWGGKSEEIVEKLESICQAKQIQMFKTLRDKGEIGYKGQILEFMKRLGQGKAIIIIISKQYLKSKSCMFELLEIAQNGQFYERIFPIVTQDSEIYNVIEKLRYLQYWEEKHSELDNEYRKLQSMSNTLGIQEELSLYSDIRNKWDQLIDVISNMNNLSLDEHLENDFAQVINAIEDRLQDSQNLKKKIN